MKGQAYINDKDIYTTWGAVLAKGAYEALLKPAPNKALIENKSRLEHGKRVIINSNICKTDERDVAISFWIKGTSESDYLAKYESFINEIISGLIKLKVPALGRVFKFTYLDCSSYGDYGSMVGKLTLKLNEANPKDRELI